MCGGLSSPFLWAVLLGTQSPGQLPWALGTPIPAEGRSDGHVVVLTQEGAYFYQWRLAPATPFGGVGQGVPCFGGIPLGYCLGRRDEPGAWNPDGFHRRRSLEVLFGGQGSGYGLFRYRTDSRRPF